ncbi:hypothetical protein [Saccharomonospora azurea]|uniref:DUF8017 domain-containing protein n=1 Tax=Saccharomonospora azurea NA-128 TaxID=882081 RepID=H8GBW3_9PSEU|nr:hypothetical protein [Saccharomonospora azurea]EHY90732.1 hypothetical protein SacazDRAFT_03872 [Saccharomonospora azurea NA-128]
MGFLRRRRDRQGGFPGYEDRAALKGFGGYEPAEPTPPTFGVPEPPRSPASPGRSPHPESTASAGFRPPDDPLWPEAPEVRLPEPRRERVPLRRQAFGCGCVVLVGVGAVVAGVLSSGVREVSSGGDRVAAPVEPIPETRVVVPAAVEGWQPVVHSDGAYAYDVPPSWQPEPGAIHGWESEPRLTLVTSAFVGAGFCDLDEDAERGGSGVTTGAEDAGDAAEAAVEAVERLAHHAYTPDGGAAPEVEVIEQRSVEVTVGEPGRAAELAVAEVTVSDPDGQCLPEKALVGALALGSGESTVVLLAYDGQDGPEATSEEDLVTLLTSLRTVPEDEQETTVVTPTR